MSTVQSTDQCAIAHNKAGAAVPAAETLVPATENPIPAMHEQPDSPGASRKADLNLDRLMTDKDRTKMVEDLIGFFASRRTAELVKLRGAINNILAEEREEDNKNYRDCPRAEVVGELVTALWYEFNGLI